VSGDGIRPICPFPGRPISRKTGRMDNETGAAANIRALVRWAITPPQSYAVYLVALVLVAGGSFYVGTLKPKKPIGFGPPPVSAPRN
jgi:hypothetical protein